MFDISTLIELDREYKASVTAMGEAYRSREPLPIAINGLSGAALDAYLIHAVKDSIRCLRSSGSSCAVCVLAGSAEERDRVASMLVAAGINAASFKDREPVFHNVRASHDTDRERLSVLHSLLLGQVDCVVATSGGALGYTMPSEVLRENSLSLSVGDEALPGWMRWRAEDSFPPAVV